MPFATRLSHKDYDALTSGIDRALLSALYDRGHRGVLVRLHALGDFFSVDYVKFWGRQLYLEKNLAVFGYTAWGPDTEIGKQIQALKSQYGKRFSIRFSNGGMDKDCAVSVMSEDTAPPGAVVCPEQTDRTQCCATCAFCWSSDKNVAFIQH